MSGNTQDVPCKGSRFNNVVIYIGQQNDAQPAKCPKTCAQRGSWANPATSTTEGLALAQLYFGIGAPCTLSIGFGTFDKGQGIIHIPTNVSLIGSGRGVGVSGRCVYLCSSIWGFPRERSRVINFFSLTSNLSVAALVTVGQPVVLPEEPAASAAVAFSNVDVTVDDLDSPAMTILATGSSLLRVSFDRCHFENRARGGTVLSRIVAEDATLHQTVTQSNLISANGTACKTVGSGNASIVETMDCRRQHGGYVVFGRFGLDY